MRKYWALIRNVTQDHFAYRLNYWLEAGGAVVLGAATLWLWRTIGSSSTNLGGYSLPELTTYLIGAGFMASYLFLTAQGDTINDDIHYGNLSTILVRPIQPLWGYWFVHALTRMTVSSVPGLLGFGLIAVVYRHDLVGPHSLEALLLTVLLIGCAVMLYFLLFVQFALLAFWSEQTWGERFFLRVLGELASGVIIPLSLLPDVLGQAARFLPFRFFAYVPMQTYLGRLSRPELLGEFGLLVVWIVVLTIGVSFTLRRGLRSYAGEGM